MLMSPISTFALIFVWYLPWWPGALMAEAILTYFIAMTLYLKHTNVIITQHSVSIAHTMSDSWRAMMDIVSPPLLHSQTLLHHHLMTTSNLYPHWDRWWWGYTTSQSKGIRCWHGTYWRTTYNSLQLFPDTLPGYQYWLKNTPQEDPLLLSKAIQDSIDSAACIKETDKQLEPIITAPWTSNTRKWHQVWHVTKCIRASASAQSTNCPTHHTTAHHHHQCPPPSTPLPPITTFPSDQPPTSIDSRQHRSINSKQQTAWLQICHRLV